MKNTLFDSRGSACSGDLAVWFRENSEGSNLCLDRLRRNLRRAREQELTPCQQQILALYYDQNMSVTQIARHLGVNTSTVSRTLRRAQDRLRRYLQYTL